jgi:hypothetical protein
MVMNVLKNEKENTFVLYNHSNTIEQSVFEKYIYVYSFALKPEDHQPSGASNFSKIDTVRLEFALRNPRPYSSVIKVFRQ